MGSRILSRSFHVEPWTGEEDQDAAAEEDAGGASAEADVIDVDNAPQETADEDPADEAGRVDQTPDLDLDDSDDDDAESPADVAMVPMADMLNARYGSENVSFSVILRWSPLMLRFYGKAKLFYEPTELRMVTTKPVKAGEQIVSALTRFLLSAVR